MKRQIVSRHMFRRRARALEDQLKIAQRDMRSGSAVKASQDLLDRYKVNSLDVLHVEAAKRGPWRWYVVAS